MFMARKSIIELKFRRRREAKTNYHKRLALVKGGIPRVVVRKSNRKVLGQIISYNEKGDVVSCSANSDELEAFGWHSRGNRATAYLTGMLLASKVDVKERGNEHVLDTGLGSPVKDSVPFVFAKGCVDNGLKIRGKFEIDENVYNFTNVAKHAEQLKKENEGAYNRQFGGYVKENAAPEAMPKLFADVKQKIMAKKGK